VLDLESLSREFGSRPAILEAGGETTYADLVKLVSTSAAWLEGVGIEPEDAEAGAVQVAARETPERRPAAVDQPRGQGGREALGRGTVARAGDGVQRAARQTAPGQRAVERGDPQRDHLDRTRRAGRAELERADAAPQGIESGAGGGRDHRRRVLSCLIYVRYLF